MPWSVVGLLLAISSVALAAAEPPGAAGGQGLGRAKQHYDAGVELFESGNKEQALVEFQLANEIAPKPANVFMIGQCEYHLGRLV